MRIDVTASALFGNEAAEDEAEDVFWSNLIRRDDIDDFESASNSIRVISAYKGEGKSSLLRALGLSMSKKDDCLVVSTTGPAAAPDIGGPDSAKWTKAWKKSLFNLIAVEVGATLNTAWNDDSISLVEESEKQGYRRRSLVATIFERLKPRLTLGGGGSSISIEKTTVDDVNHQKIIERYRGDGIKYIWLIVDDVDRNYRDTKQDKAKIIGFFDAIRDMHNAVPQLRIRTSLRPNVYSSVKLEAESFSHVRQYIKKISWSDVQIRELLARRIEGYLARNAWLDNNSLPRPGPARDAHLIGLVFDTPVKWGRADGVRSIHVPLYTLSVHRPRWIIELCKVAAARAKSRKQPKISLDDILKEMAEFGQNRRSDVVAEFRPQCQQLDEMIDAFYGGKSIYTTDELMSLIEQKILSAFTPNIAGMSEKARAGDVASFLFEVGIFFGRSDSDDGNYEHISFAQRPGLLRSRVSPGKHVRWEIHPVFRQILNVHWNESAEADW